jgi:hypothetical protein
MRGARRIELEPHRRDRRARPGLRHQLLQQRRAEAHAHVALVLWVEREPALLGDVEAPRQRGREQRGGLALPLAALAERTVGLERVEYEIERAGKRSRIAARRERAPTAAWPRVWVRAPVLQVQARARAWMSREARRWEAPRWAA